MAGEQCKRLESERTRLQRQRQQREDAIEQLVSTLEGGNGASPAVIGKRIGERQSEVEKLNQRLTAIEDKLAALPQHGINRDHLVQTLTRFTELWDVLHRRERIELIHALIDRIIYNAATNDLDVQFKTPE